jgi:hypothetical protein
MRCACDRDVTTTTPPPTTTTKHTQKAHVLRRTVEGRTFVAEAHVDACEGCGELFIPAWLTIAFERAVAIELARLDIESPLPSAKRQESSDLAIRFDASVLSPGHHHAHPFLHHRPTT